MIWRGWLQGFELDVDGKKGAFGRKSYWVRLCALLWIGLAGMESCGIGLGGYEQEKHSAD